MEIEELLRKLIGATDFFSKIGTAYAIDSTKRTCSVALKNGDADLHGVRLQALQELDTGVVFVPAEKSDVIVGFLDENEAFVVSTSKISKVEILTDGEVFLNGDSFGGLVQIENLTKKLNSLVVDVNKLATKFNVHTHITTATVSATPVPGIISPTTTRAETTKSFNVADYENKTVKHG